MKPPQMSKDFPDAFYRVTAKGLYIRDDKVLLIHDFTSLQTKKDVSPEWELPGGGVDFGENPTDTLRREVKEETGLTISSIEERPLFVWSTRCGVSRGMEWYYVMTLIFRIEFESLDFTPTEECQEIRFFSKQDLEDNIGSLATQIVPLAKAFHPFQIR